MLKDSKKVLYGTTTGFLTVCDVYNSFDLNVPFEDNIDISNNTNSTNDISILTKYFLKFQMFNEFLIGGSLRFLIIKKNEIENLNNLKCLNNGKCLISEKKSKILLF